MKINIHAGHNPDTKVACGAAGLIKESTEARKVKDEVIRLLKAENHTIYDCTCDNGTSQSDVLNKIISKSNAHPVDLDISIHFNAGANDKKGNRKTTGTEILLYSASSKAKPYAERVIKKMEQLGFKNRGLKYRTDLAVLRRTGSPAMLIEVCFVDDMDDIMIYDYKAVAKAIVEGILNKSLDEPVLDKTIYKVQCGAFSSKSNADELASKLKKDGYSVMVVK